jgi:hypothetical protein
VLDLLGNAGRIGVVGITPRDVVRVGRVEQPALHLVLEEVPDRLPVAPGRLHPHPGHPVAGRPCAKSRRTSSPAPRLSPQTVLGQVLGHQEADQVTRASAAWPLRLGWKKSRVLTWLALNR